MERDVVFQPLCQTTLPTTWQLYPVCIVFESRQAASRFHRNQWMTTMDGASAETNHRKPSVAPRGAPAPSPPTSDSRGRRVVGSVRRLAGWSSPKERHVGCDGDGHDVDLALGTRTRDRVVGGIPPADRVLDTSRRRPAGRSVLFGSTSDASVQSPRFVGCSRGIPIDIQHTASAPQPAGGTGSRGSSRSSSCCSSQASAFECRRRRRRRRRRPWTGPGRAVLS